MIMKQSSLAVPLQAYLCGASLLQIPASGRWDGTDGPWSTFSITIGNPQQKLRLLPSFFGTSLAPIDGGRCQKNSCPSDAELSYIDSNSSTWKNMFSASAGGPAPLGYEYQNWFYKASSVYGNDNFGLIGVDGMPRNIVNSSFVTPLYNYVNLSTGVLGLSLGPTGFGSGIFAPSLLTQLYEMDLIEDTTWSYTAGSSSINTTGSLVLNGYDLSHLNRNTSLTISERELTVASNFYLYLHSITDQEKGSLLSLQQSTKVYMNSDVAQIWLSYEVCKNFEITYGLVWNDTYQYYLLDDAKHDQMKRDNISLYFKVQPSQGHRDSVSIEVPYHAMDLKVDINGSLHYYYPIRPTRITDQYVLGRAFFQAAYIIVDYGNQSLELGQARFPYRGEAAQLRTIGTKQSHSRSSGGIIGGLVAGIVVLLLVVAFLVWKWRSKSQRETASLLVEPPEPTFATLLHGSHKPELAATPTAPPPAYRKRLWSNATTVSEVDGIDTMLTSRLDCLREELSEVPEKHTPEEPYMPLVELEGSYLSPAELDAGFRGFEAGESTHLNQRYDNVTTSNGSEQDEFASPPSAPLPVDHDEPVSPLASRSGSRASARDARALESAD